MERLTCVVACCFGLACSAEGNGAGSGVSGTSSTAAASGAGASLGGGSGSLSAGTGGGLVLNPSAGTDTGGSGNAGGAASQEDCGNLKIIVRDFSPMHPDFENPLHPPYAPADALTTVPGIVAPTLGMDGNPSFANNGQAGGRVSVTDATSFSQWYTDVAGTNQRFEIDLQLATRDGDAVVYDSAAFFPIDGQGFGDYMTWGHNFHFTTETRLEFRYQGGEVFTFRGDDDLWMFIDKKLALDLGGIHAAVEGTVDLDVFAASNGLVRGELYSMDIFHAERHIGESNFRIETTIGCVRPVAEPR
jgi:fibro-slime domain-containing protein